jgi:hypothetical protein
MKLAERQVFFWSFHNIAPDLKIQRYPFSSRATRTCLNLDSSDFWIEGIVVVEHSLLCGALRVAITTEFVLPQGHRGFTGAQCLAICQIHEEISIRYFLYSKKRHFTWRNLGAPGVLAVKAPLMPRRGISRAIDPPSY